MINQSSPAMDLYVRGELPRELDGSFVIACSRRHKDRKIFFRWHDSQTDLVRIDITPGKPGRARAKVLTVDPSGQDVGAKTALQANHRNNRFHEGPLTHYLTQPNHGLNVENGNVWATNLLFGFPLEVDLWKWKARRLLQSVETDADNPRVTSIERDRRWS